MSPKWSEMTYEEKIEVWKEEGHVEVPLCQAPLVIFKDSIHTPHCWTSYDRKKLEYCPGERKDIST